MTYYLRWPIFVMTLLCVALGQPARSSILGLVSSLCGYAFFWHMMLGFSKLSQRFVCAFLWYFCVLAIQLSWLATPEYHGWYIYIFYFLMLFFWGVQFGVLSLFISRKTRWYHYFLIPSLWVLFEWSRLYILSGFSWNPVGLAWTGFLYPLQFASLGGVYLLSFWAFLLNICVLSLLQKYSHKKGALYLFLVLIPFVYGWGQIHYQSAQSVDRVIDVLLVQTAITPGEKMGFPGDPTPRIAPVVQWKKLLLQLKSYKACKIDLIVFPEAAIPFHSQYAFYLYRDIVFLFDSIFNKQPLPSSDTYVTNQFIYQSLSAIFNSDIIVGLEYQEENDYYNATFLFSPGKTPTHYSKTILVPMGEYIPFQWTRKIAEQYGIQDSFSRGGEVLLLKGRIPYAVSICYEDTFGYYITKFVKQNPELLVNTTNDSWFPNSMLYRQHADHARLRTVENGLPLVKSSNIGGTVAYSSTGALIGRLPEGVSGVLKVKVSLHQYNTLFRVYGDFTVVLISFLLIIIVLVFKKKTINSSCL